MFRALPLPAWQSTLKHAIFFQGTGLHSGRLCRVEMRPAPPNSGICFRTSSQEAFFRLSADRAQTARLSTAIAPTPNSPPAIRTVEHLLSALHGIAIDNVRITVQGGEIPILDGGCADLVFLLQRAGRQEQEAQRRYIEILNPVTVEGENESWATLHPFPERLRISHTIHFPNSRIGQQRASILLNENNFRNLIAPSRTFVEQRHVEYLKKAGHIQGGSLANALVLGENGPLNPGGMRHGLECVYHKILDVIGDLYLTGHPVLGAFQGYKSGHAINQKLLRAVLADRRNWRFYSPERVV